MTGVPRDNAPETESRSRRQPGEHKRSGDQPSSGSSDDAGRNSSLRCWSPQPPPRDVAARALVLVACLGSVIRAGPIRTTLKR